MKFIPRQVRDDVNVSPEHPLIEATTLVVGLGLIFAAVMVALIFLVDILLFFLPEEKEIRMFRSWLPDDLVTVAIDDPRLESLEDLVARLSRHWPETKYPFRVEVDDTPELNAMAFPGGLIVVTSGLIDQVQSENELAFVIGHELGHYKNRDHMRGLGRGAVIGILFAAISTGNSSSTMSASLADLTLRGFSRRQEAAADRFGLELVQTEYGHVADSWRFFERIGSSDPGFTNLASYVSTHPPPKNRIVNLRDYAIDRGWPTSGDVTPLQWPIRVATPPDK